MRMFRLGHERERGKTKVKFNCALIAVFENEVNAICFLSPDQVVSASGDYSLHFGPDLLQEEHGAGGGWCRGSFCCGVLLAVAFAGAVVFLLAGSPEVAGEGDRSLVDLCLV